MAAGVADEAHDPAAAPPARSSRLPDARMSGRVLLYAGTTFLSAFLLFQVQPLIAKYILPWFGGGSTVWTTTMLFFQVALLAGYAYAHFVSDRLPTRAQALLHIALLALAAIALPIIPDATWKPAADADPTWRILLLLAATVGAPYVLLSATAPLVQRWFAREQPETSPYRLYALSNTGSLLALISYPVIFERLFGLERQAWLWSGGYVLFALLCGAIAWGVARRAAAWRASDREVAPAPHDAVEEAVAAPSLVGVHAEGGSARVTPLDVALWLVLPACASVVLLATTNQMTQDVAAIPLLWVLPLALYLLTFILCFGDDRAYRPMRDGVLLAVALAGGAYVLGAVTIALLWQILLYSAALFMCCFTLHGELVRLRPAARHLTAFYLAVSVGGALGGLLVAIAAPAVFDGYWEYHLGLVATALLVLLARALDARRRGWTPLAVRDAADPVDPAEPTAGARTPRWVLPAAGAAAVAGIAVLALVLGNHVRDGGRAVIERNRNFYGTVRVYDFTAATPIDSMRVMEHGHILHGFQYLSPERRRLHSGYYGDTSGFGVAMRNHPGRGAGGLSVGILGLGAGMAAAYAEPGDRWSLYEINPMVSTLAEQSFTYLEDARARGATMDTFIGDGRLVLERQLADEGPRGFDVLVLDAFNSDSIPVHLLTKEAFEMYRRHLKPGGVIAVNISNRHIDISPVVRAAAAAGGEQAHWVSSHAGDAPGALNNVWMLVTANRDFIAMPKVASELEPWPDNARDPVLWTDDFSSVYDLLRLY